ncbi:MAG TPA: peptidylprolyl isomerase [Alphaproteobacteria bacterium]|nr:peptidylprolyl isomerase [Alphaproteobacteria bacterium]
MRICVVMVFLLGFAAAAQAPAKKAAPAQKKATPAAPKPAGKPTTILHTQGGDMKCELFPDQAPKAVANFIGLATGKKIWTNPTTGKLEKNHPYYNGVIFHRVIPDFMIQSGDPTGTGKGGPGYRFDDELHADLLFDRPGRLAMANSGPNTNGSQFFITEKEVPWLNPCLDEGGCLRGKNTVPKGTGYTIFGQCDDATIDLVKRISRMPRDQANNNRPYDPVKIETVEIRNAGSFAPAKTVKKRAGEKPKTSAPATKTPK